MKRSGSTTILLIGLFKLFKALLLIAVGIGALKLLHKNVADVATHWIEVLRVDPENRFIHPMLSKLFRIGPKQLKELSAGTFFYAALLLVEGVGLLMRKHWAEYFTAIMTAALIPLEVYELAKHFTAAKVIVLLVNVAIVVYLVARLRGRRGGGRSQPRTTRATVLHK
ncbi:MAG: DUF2127 domain-containing protein [Acidobacteriaceae bacterium]|nr:DUF2127 domain-containing protein [Acidobacteriaceae bacterium]MBV9295705.1 DUF2127 domain-containing protein [Acidobacteriaceae bacterium]MBV9766453.1 DUF2127 domain-containing protein [Acidobacteriaceae bacterium]